MVRRVVGGLVDWSGRHPLWVIVLALLTLVGSWKYASNLEPRTDYLELLPRESPGFKAFEHQLGRVGGGATLIVIAESPDRKANERFIDDVNGRIAELHRTHEACVAACKPDDGACRAGCGPRLVGYIESGTKDTRKFFEDNKWLYAELKDLKDADATIDHQVAIRSGLIDDFDDELENDKAPAPAPAPAASSGAPPTPTPPATETKKKKAALGLDDYRERWKSQSKKHDDFPTGYFATDDGTMIGLRVVSATTGTGDRAGDILLEKVRAMAQEMKPATYHPQMKVGFAGDIPNAVAEKESIVSEALWATGIALAVIVVGILIFFAYRSPLSYVIIALPVIVLPAFLGVGCAYAFAMARYGYVNTTGAFLGAIIVGNGINYPIILLTRYREFRTRGMDPPTARRESVLNALRAELVGACVASIAYGSLTITRFRGFNQFGMIGFVGMLMVWLTMIPCVPALLVVMEGIEARLPAWMRKAPPPKLAGGEPAPGLLTGPIAKITQRAPWAFVVAGLALSAVAAVKLPGYIRDPWEYNFDKLGSRGSKQGGAGEWSNKAEKVFGGKMNIAGVLLLADTPEQVPDVKARILETDKADPQGTLVAEIATVADLLPGTPEEQREKLKVLDSIRERLNPATLEKLPADERKRVEEIIPPTTLKALEAKDLPALMRRRFEENNGKVGTVFYVKYNNSVSFSDGRTLLRIAARTDNVKLNDGTIVQTASRATIFAEMIRSMERDGPLATFASFIAVAIVVLVATHNLRGALAVLAVLVMGVLWTVGGAALSDMKLNFVNFIALPITFGIGCEYPFNVYDRSRLLGGDVSAAVRRVGGAVILCSYTTTVGYGSLLFADNQALQSFGRLAMSGEIATLVGAVLVLPALLHVIRRLWSGAPTSAADRRNPAGS